MAEAVQRKKNILFIRALLTLIILLLGLYNLNAIVESQQYVFFYLFLVLASNFVFLFLKDEFFEGTRGQYVIFMLDFVIIALGAYWLAFLDFKMFMVISLTILLSALSPNTAFSLVIAAVVNVVYFSLKIAASEHGAEVLTDDLALLNVPFIFIIALESSYLAEKAREEAEEKNRLESANVKLSKKIKSSEQQFNEAVFFMSKVYDSFREGIIILDTYGVVRSYNKPCEYIFGVKKSKVINLSYRELNFLGEVQDKILDLKNKKVACKDEEVVITSGNTEKRLFVNTAFIKDDSGSVIGILCTVMPVFSNINREV